MIISTITENQATDPKFMKKIIEQVISSVIPPDIKKHFSDEQNRRIMVETYGSDSFLSPDELKYPIINPKTGDYDCKLIYCSRLAALKNNERELYEAATNAYYVKDCTKFVMIEVEGHEKGYDLLDLLTVLELDFKE